MAGEHDRLIDSVIARQRLAKVRVRFTGLVILVLVIAWPVRYLVSQWGQWGTETLQVTIPSAPPVVLPGTVVSAMAESQKRLQAALKMDRESFLNAFPAKLAPVSGEKTTVAPLTAAYIVQAMEVDDYESAEEQVKRLRAERYRAFVSSGVRLNDSADEGIFRVMVGPDLRQPIVEQWQKALVDRGMADAKVLPWMVSDTLRLAAQPAKEDGP